MNLETRINRAWNHMTGGGRGPTPAERANGLLPIQTTLPATMYPSERAARASMVKMGYAEQPAGPAGPTMLTRKGITFFENARDERAG